MSASNCLDEWKLYMRQLPGLIAGRAVPVHRAGVTEPGEIKGRSDDELRLLIALAERRLDALAASLEHIRQRAQFLFSTLLALLGLAAAAVPMVVEEGLGTFLVWFLGAAVLVLALLGAAGIVVNRKVLGVVTPAWLSQQGGSWLLASATEHLASIAPSADTEATQITLYRDAALLTIIGSLVVGVSWVWALVAAGTQ